MSDVSKLEEKAVALVKLKASLGGFYDVQKKQLVDQIKKVPLSEAINIFPGLVSSGFLNEQELSNLLDEISSNPAPVEVPSTSQAKNPSSIDLKDSTTVEEIVELFKSTISDKGKAGFYGETLTDIKNTLGIQTLLEILDLDDSNRNYNILNDVLDAEKIAGFQEIMNELKKYEHVAKRYQQELKVIEEIENKKKQFKVLNESVFDAWRDNGNFLFIPENDLVHFYCNLQLGTEGGEERARKNQEEEEGEVGHVFFCLDISSSMNHDEHGKYLAPESRDHQASSVKKARDLLPHIVLPAIKRNDGVTAILWNSEIDTIIHFKPDMFMTSAEPKELLSDEEIIEKVKTLSSESVFVARGATNIQLLLRELVKEIKKVQSAHRLYKATVWLLTDGEETAYVKDDGKITRIPTNKSASNYNYFNLVNNDGITQYQCEMLNQLSTSCREFQDNNLAIDFHICQFSEADPIFLKSMRAATNGHFHTFVDLSSIRSELEATNVVNSTTVIELILSGRSIDLPATEKDQILYARGTIPIDAFIDNILSNNKVVIKIKSISKALPASEIAFENISTDFISEDLRASIFSIISLESKFEAIINELNENSYNLTMILINNASNELVNLRKIRIESLEVIRKRINGKKFILQFYLESILESVEAQIESLERLLLQFQLKQSQQYDIAVSNSNEFLTQREKLAISAGLESMKVRLGNGIVTSASHDKQVRKLIALHSARANKMLQRKAILVETPTNNALNTENLGENKAGEDEDYKYTVLSLYIVEDNVLNNVKQKILKQYLPNNFHSFSFQQQKSIVYTQSYVHNAENEEVEVVINIRIQGVGVGDEVIELKYKFKDLIYHIVSEYHTKAHYSDVEQWKMKYIDPLSYSNYFELIRENNTLPAYLYTVKLQQGIGIIFNSRELLYVASGGMEFTSFDYFRLFWKLASQKGQGENEENKDLEIKLPGTFFKANIALPIAIEPIGMTILSTMMVGLLSEPITGSPMALLSSSGMLYCGYLFMHMRKSEIKAIDISRMVELLTTIKSWIDNPFTQPIAEEITEVIENQLIPNYSVNTATSPGKFMPIKAIVYSILDEKVDPFIKYFSLQNELIKRHVKLLFSPPTANTRVHNKDSDLFPDIKVITNDLVQLFADHLKNNQLIPVENADNPENTVIYFMEASDIIGQMIRLSNPAHLQQNPSEEEKQYLAFNILDSKAGNIDLFFNSPVSSKTVNSFFSNNQYLEYIFNFVHHLFSDLSKQLFTSSSWPNCQRILLISSVLNSASVSTIQALFKQYKSTSHIEQAIENSIAPCNNPSYWENALFSFINDKKQFILVAYNKANQQVEIYNLSVAGGGQLEDKYPSSQFNSIPQEILFEFWKLFYLIASRWRWSGRKGNAYGLLNVDYDIIAAIKDSSKVPALSQTQLSEYNQAMSHRNKNYAAYVPEKAPEVKISNEDNASYTYAADLSKSGKARMNIVVVGNFDAGKSTTCGHLIFNTGGLSKYQMEKYEQISNNYGKSSFKYAWIFDKLKTEREMGRTVTLGFWCVPTENYDVSIIDSPGTKSFFKNLSCGAALADVCILLVSAVAGEFESGIDKKGMTRQESLLAYAFGIRSFIVLVNKMDSVGYSQSRFDEITNEIGRMLTRIGIQQKAIPFIPISGWVGDNLTEKSTNMPWYNGWKYESSGKELTGYTIIDAIESLPPPLKPVHKPLRMPVLQVHKIAGVGTVAISHVVSGVLKKSDKLTILPGNKSTSTTSIELYHNALPEGYPGDVIGVHLKGISSQEVSRGMVIASTDNLPGPHVDSFIARVIILDVPNEIKSGAVPTFYCHLDTFAGKIKLLELIDKRTGNTIETEPKGVKANQAVKIEVFPLTPIWVEPFTQTPPLGRFVFGFAHEVNGFGAILSVNYHNPAPQKRLAQQSTSKYFKR